MRLTFASWGAIAGIAIALIVLAGASIVLLNSGGANYKVLVAVWLWLLPALGLFGGLGYGAGKIVDVVFAGRSGKGTHADADA